MKKVMLLAVAAIMLYFSCKKSAGSTGDKLSGVYIESSPVSGRSYLNFVTNNLVIKSEAGSPYKDTFYYSISAGKISLKPYWTNDYTASDFYFNEFNADSFTIGNLYASIPEAAPTNMVYKR